MVKLSFKSTCRNPKGRVVWRYSHANWDRACDLIEAIDWSSLLDPTDINRSWTQWSKTFLSIMEKCIPKATLPRRKNRPWLSKKILQAMRRRNMYYKRAKACKDYSKYKAYQNKVTAMLKEASAKKNFSRRLIQIIQRNSGKPAKCLVVHLPPFQACKWVLMLHKPTMKRQSS